MAASTVVAVTPATEVGVPASYSLHQRITVTNGAGGATLTSLLTGGVVPAIPVPNRQDGAIYSIGYVDLQSETDPTTIAVRFTRDGQTVPTSTLGFVVPGGTSIGRAPVHPDQIKLISTGADVNIQVYLGINGVA